MATLNDAMMDGLAARGFTTGALNDRLHAFSIAAGAPANATLNDAIFDALGLNGATGSTLMDRWMSLFDLRGIPAGTWNDRSKTFWETPPALTILAVPDQFWYGTTAVNLAITAVPSGPPDPSVGPYTWSIVSGSLPAGLVFNSPAQTDLDTTITGTMSSPANATGSLTIRITATGGSPLTADKTINWSSSAAMGISPTAWPDTTLGTAMTPVQMLVVNGFAPHTWSRVGGAQVTVAPTTGIITWNPVNGATGARFATIRCIDSKSNIVSAICSVTVLAAATSNFLLEDGTDLLLEDGTNLLLE